MACIAKRRGRYVIDFYDHRGKRRWKTLPKGTIKKKAREAMRDIEDLVLRGIYISDKKIPLFSKVAEDWLEQKKMNVRSSTWSTYKGHVDNHFDDVNDIKVNRITTPKVEKFIIKKREKGMNITTLRKVIVTFNQVMKYATRHNFIDHNPVTDAERPKKQGRDEEEKIHALTPKQINSLIDATEGQMFKMLFRLAIMSGARKGELLGLKWTDIDWFNGQMYIQRTFNHGEWYKPKSKASKRKIDLGPDTIMDLKKWKIACPKFALNLVFPSNSGTPLNHSHILSRNFYPTLEKAKLPKVRFHDLRHTYASLLIDQGENIKYIQNQLGHSSPMLTLSVYAHLMNPTNQRAARQLENTVFKPTGSKVVAVGAT
jgi:integrase